MTRQSAQLCCTARYLLQVVTTFSSALKDIILLWLAEEAIVDWVLVPVADINSIKSAFQAASRPDVFPASLWIWQTSRQHQLSIADIRVILRGL